MRSAKSLLVISEGLIFFLTILLMLLILGFLQSGIKQDYINRQVDEINKIDKIIDSYIKQRKEKFDSYIKLNNKIDAALLLTEYSDIYLLDDSLRIKKIFKKNSSSNIFVQFSFQTAQVAKFFRDVKGSIPQASSMYRSPEQETLSIYIAARTAAGLYVGRVDMSKININLINFEKDSDNIVILATKDGYVLSCSIESIPLRVLPDKSQTELLLDKEYLYTRKTSQALDNDIVLLMPLSDVYYILRSIRNFYPIIIGVLFAVMLIKVLIQYYFGLRPLENFIGMLKKWDVDLAEPHPPEPISKIMEMQILYDTFRDKTEQIRVSIEEIRQKEHEMRKMRRYLKNIIDSMPSMLISINDEGLVTEWNEAAARYTGVSASEIMGKYLWETAPFLIKFKDDCENVFKTGMGGELKKEKLDNGGERFVNISLFPLAENGIRGIAIRLDDITAIEKTERQLVQSQKMEVVGTLAGGLAHDFNNVLGGIVGTVSMIQFLLKSTDDIRDIRPEIEDYISVIEQSSARAADMIRQLLTLTRRQEQDFKQVDLNQTISNVKGICANSFDKSIDISVNYYSEPALTLADANQMEQMLLNLCVNAAHSMTFMRGKNEKHGGILAISLKLVLSDKFFIKNHPDAIEESDYWALTVDDSGVGMNAKLLTKIFDPFFTTKDKGKGTGLGLSMVYTTIQMHRGFVDVYSEPGRGTSVIVYLPVLRELPPSDETNELNTLKRGSGLILIVDDEVMIRVIARDILRQCGYEVILAADGEEALNIFRERGDEIRLILLDMAMPRKNGIETYQEMKIIKEDVAVLLSSGFQLDERVQAALDIGIRGFIQKPYTIDLLSNAVYKILYGKID